MTDNPYESPREAGHEAPHDPRADEERVRMYFTIMCIGLGAFIVLTLGAAILASIVTNRPF